MNNGFSPSRRAWNRVMTILVWASAVLVMILVAGIIGMCWCGASPHQLELPFLPPPVC